MNLVSSLFIKFNRNPFIGYAYYKFRCSITEFDDKNIPNLKDGSFILNNTYETATEMIPGVTYYDSHYKGESVNSFYKLTIEKPSAVSINYRYRGGTEGYSSFMDVTHMGLYFDIVNSNNMIPKNMEKCINGIDGNEMYTKVLMPGVYYIRVSGYDEPGIYRLYEISCTISDPEDGAQEIVGKDDNNIYSCYFNDGQIDSSINGFEKCEFYKESANTTGYTHPVCLLPGSFRMAHG